VIEILQRVGFFPRACVWELTLACNLRCKHCGSIAGSKRPDELSLDECMRVAGELVELGCRRITLSGGEPTMYPGWHEGSATGRAGRAGQPNFQPVSPGRPNISIRRRRPGCVARPSASTASKKSMTNFGLPAPS